MTRETKVGLLVGMGVILLIGIIVSDHLSQAPPPAILTTYAHEAQESIAPEAPRGGYPLYAEAEPAASEPLPLEVAPPPALPQEVLPQERYEPPVMSHRPLMGAGRIETMIPPTDSDGMDHPNGGTARDDARVIEAFPDDFQPGAPGGRDQREERDRRSAPSEQVETERRWQAETVPEDRVVLTQPAEPEPQPIIHFVKDDETLWGLAERYYGSGTAWRTIVDANAGKIPANHQVREGVRLVIPRQVARANEEVQGSTTQGRAEAQAAQRPAQVADVRDVRDSRESRGTPSAQAAARTITVEPRDTLSSLAKRHLGAEKLWRELYDANRSVIKNPDLVPAGTVLTLPVASATGSARTTVSGSGPERDQPVQRKRVYTVQRDDTLYSIAQRELGSGNRWRDIYKANQNVIENPDRVPPGLELDLPAADRS